MRVLQRRPVAPGSCAAPFRRRVASVTVGRRTAGRCLCGAVRYEVRGPPRDVLLCHCVECRRWSGHVFAATSVRRDQLVLLQSGALRWVSSPESESEARRGFCCECGSSLFWDAPARDSISIAAGTLEEPTGLRLLGHVYVAHAGDYYELPTDGLPRYERLSGAPSSGDT
jgi:hypothetical protein